MTRRLLVTGYGGFVASSVVWQAAADTEVHAVSRRRIAPASDHAVYHNLDLLDASAVAPLFKTIQPDAVIHCAAIADIDYCETHRDEAEAVNVGVTKTLARLCAETGARLIHCSTDTVFDGIKGRYTEDDAPGPLNFYAETKARVEGMVRELAANHVIARLSLVMGLPLSGGGNSFLAKMIDALEKGATVKMPANEIRTPVDVITVGAALLELAFHKLTGIIHLAGNTRLNRYEMGRVIARRLGFAEELIAPVDSNAMPGRAPRPNDASLDNALARQTLTTPMLSLEDGLDLVLRGTKRVHS